MTGNPCIDYGFCGTGDPCIDYGYCPENPSPEPDPCEGCQTPNPVTPVANHQLSNTSRLPPRQTSDTQVGATCVFKTMEWISKYFGGSKTVGTFILEYGLSKGMDLIQIMAMINSGGVPASDLNSLVGSHFNITSSSNLQTSINNGHPVMATIGAANGGHEVMITGYYNDGKIEYFDPETGTYGSKPANEFSHLIEIISLK